MPDNEHSSLVSSHKSPDSGLQIHLHPLVLLTVSDHITRHTLRRREEPIVGALLGQQNGRDITLEHAFECQVVQGEHDGAVLLHQTWFQDRLQQYKDVHKEPALELVGWFTTAPMTGPEPQHVPIHQQIIHDYNETAVLLAFHPTDVLAGASQSGRLPLTIYESVYETVGKAGNSDGEGDRSMDLDAPEGPLEMRFRELPYSVETGEAEMIGVDFVARGGGNATNIDAPAKQKGKEKSSKSQQPEAKTVNDASVLSPEDEELITSLTARANAVKMLHTRIQLLKSYLTTLPPSYLSSTSYDNNNNTTASEEETPSSPQPQIDHSILRSIQALAHRLPLLIPADGAAFANESLAEKSDVSLVALLGELTKGTKNMREMGRKFGIVGSAKQRHPRAGGGRSQLYEDAGRYGEEGMMSMDKPYE
ncbi:MAG: hypothetical protein LQ344_008064 [Seirophora lacunosa]|nr:MAG: hypothetical protein LQ344_008064 [Seirophora lacunosa]